MHLVWSRLALPCLMGAVSLFACPVASPQPARSDPPPLSEGDARAAGLRLLREQRWNEAIAAFAQSWKAIVPSFRHPRRWDPRSEEVRKALISILADLDARKAPDSEKLPYWEFYLQHYPFFSVLLGSGRGERHEPWMKFQRLAADARLGLLDPRGDDPRFWACRMLARLSGDRAWRDALVLLEKEWPGPHEDGGACSVHAFRVLDEAVAREDSGLRAERAWSVYAHRFADAPCLGYVAQSWDREEKGLAIARNPVARRWSRVIAAGEWDWANGPSETSAELRALCGPWMDASMEEGWYIRELLRVDTTEGDENTARVRARGTARLAGMSHRFPGTIGLAYARYYAFWPGTNPEYHRFKDVDSAELTAWRREAPADDLADWAYVQILELRMNYDAARRLTTEQRAVLGSIQARFAGEALEPFVELLFALDDGRGGDWSRVFERYRRVWAFDPAGVRRPGPLHASEARARAREPLLVYARIREPKKMRELVPEPEEDTVIGGEDWFCGTVSSWVADDHAIARIAQYRAIGRDDLVLRLLEEAMGWFSSRGYDRTAAIEFADECVRQGELDLLRERIRRGREELAQKREEARRGHERQLDEEEGILDAMAWILDAESIPDGELFARVESKLSRVLARMDEGKAGFGDSGLLDASLVVLDRRRATPRLVPRPPVGAFDARSLFHAGLLGDAVMIDHLLEAFLREQRDSGKAELIWRFLARDGRLTLARIVSLLMREGVGLWTAFRWEVDAYLGIEEQLAVLREFIEHSDPVIRDWARLTLAAVRESNPWTCWCLEGR